MKDPRAKILERLVDGPPKPKPIRYAIYTRQSVDKLADFSSCQAQFDTCRDFAEASGASGQVWCGQHFDDEGQSGATLERPAMRQCRENTHDSQPSRTARKASESGQECLDEGAKTSPPVPAA